MASQTLTVALGRIARAVSGTVALDDVFRQVAEETATVLPFDAMGVSCLDEAETLTLHSFAGKGPTPPRQVRLGDFSPAIRPLPGGPRRVDDLIDVADPSFSVDRRLQETGVRSLLLVPMRASVPLRGFVGVNAHRARAFTDEHEAALAAIADLLGLVLEHERRWARDAALRQRLDTIDTVLPVLAQVLDVRSIFNQVSGVIRPVLPHDRLALSTLSDDRRMVTVDALSGEPIPEFPTRVPAPDRGLDQHEHELVPDVEEAGFDPERRRRCQAVGIRSLLKLPLRIDGGTVGWLSFLSEQPNQYSELDVLVARRVADHLSLALSHQRLAEEAQRAAEARERAAQLERRVEALQAELATTRGYGRVVGESDSWRSVLAHVAKVGPTDTTVLLSGESGTGKEVVARLIHRGSPRSEGPFVAINCAALPESLLESELFGHEKGAFTGAVSLHVGSIEEAAGGVLFLDEIGELTLPMQAKLLRVLQEREFRRVGGNRTRKAEVRIIAATNRDLPAAMARGSFREDLYYRLHVFEIALPPLRDRVQDILPLAEAFLEELGQRVGRPAGGLSRAARDVLLSYSWPGNVRELRNVLERATILCDGGLIAAEHLPRDLGRRPADGRLAGVDLRGAERELIVRALQSARNNRSHAARLLGITRAQLYRRLAKHGIPAR
jgi:transcriptional regulator with GAF, ATPase, and Fis domain